MAWTQTQLDALEAAIAVGAMEVQYQDKKVKYNSLDDMLKVRDMMRRDLGILPDRRAPQRLLASPRKGTT